MTKLKQLIGAGRAMLSSALCLLSCVLLALSARAAEVTCTRTVLSAGQSTNLVTGVYTAASTEERGGVFNVSSGATLMGTGITFAGNETTKEGGAIYSKGIISFSAKADFSDNVSASDGGAISTGGEVTFSGAATFERNSGLYGGAVANSGILTFAASTTFADNRAAGNENAGGAIENYGGTITFADVVFSGNSANNGGAIYNENDVAQGKSGVITFANGATFTNNTTTVGNGGAIYNSGAIVFAGLMDLQTSGDTWYNEQNSTVNWDLTGGLEQYGSIAHFERYLADAVTQLISIRDDQPAGDYVIATGDFTNLAGKDAFVLTNVTSGVTTTIAIGGDLVALGETYWKLATVEAGTTTNLVLSAVSPAKLSNVELIDGKTGATNATAVVKVGETIVTPNADGTYSVLQGMPITVVYTASEDYMFDSFGAKTKTVTLGPLTDDYAMTDDDKPTSEAAWADEREIAIDTRERIIVTTPEDVLPIAYSTNGWGWAEALDAYDLPYNVVLVVDGKPLLSTNQNGYAEWMPEVGAYGKYDIGQSWLSQGMSKGSTNATVYYSQPYALTVTQPTEGGTITATANTADAEAGTVLGYDFVDIVAEPTDATWALKTWSVTTNGVAAQEILTKDAAALTNRFEMPLCDTTLAAAFVIADAYRAELAAAATNDYVAATNGLESLRMNRLSDAETDAALAAAKGALDTAAGSIAAATKPGEADAAKNALANALAEIEDAAAGLSGDKPYEFVIASDFSANPPFEDFDPDTGTFTWNGKTWTVGVDAFTSFTDAFTNETYGAFATNVHVFGMQTIATEPQMTDAWNLDLVAYEDADGNDVSPVVTVAKGDGGALVNITNNLGQITGEGDIILGKTSDAVDPSVYADFIADGADISVTNAGAEPMADGGNVSVEVDKNAKADMTEGGGFSVLLPGVENLTGDISINVRNDATNDVEVAGRLDAPNGNVTIRNYSTNELAIADTVNGGNIYIKNYGKDADAEGAIIARDLRAVGEVVIDNRAHLEANVKAGGKITIRNGSPNTIVGTYDGATVSITGGDEGAISNVTFVSDGPVTMEGINVLTGPFAIEAPEGAITNKGTLAWNICGGNFTAKLADFDAVEFEQTQFDVYVDVEQEVGRYVLAENAGSLAVTSLCVTVREDLNAFAVKLGEGFVVSASAKRLYCLDLNEVDALVLTVIDTSTYFDQTAYTVREGGAVTVCVRGGSMEHAVQATLSYVKGTGSYTAAYVNGKQVSFPLRLNWKKGEMGVKEILFQTAADAGSKYDRMFTLQLSAPVGENVVPGYDVCTVTLKDAQGKSAQYKYVRALAYPANAGTVTGAGTLTSKTKWRTLKAKSNKIGTFKGWYAAKADDPNVPDLSKRLTTKASYKAKKAGTYFACFANVKAVPTIKEPAVSSKFATTLDSRTQTIKGQVGVRFYLSCSSMGARIKVSKLPVGLTWDAKNKRIVGVPRKTGTYTLVLKAANGAGTHVMTYKVVISAMPKQAIGTWYGVVRNVDGRPGVGSVKMTVGSTGKISAKVVTLSGTHTFSANGYYRDGDTALKRTLTSAKGEKFAFTLDLTGDWATRQIAGTISGGAFAKEGSAGTFGLVRNPYDAKSGNPEARQLLAAYVGTYARGMYLGTTKKGSASFQVKSNGNVLTKATVGSKTFSGTLPGGLKVWDDGSGTIEAALGLKNMIWSADVGLDFVTRTLEGDARYMTKSGTDWALTFGLPAPK